MLFGPEAKRRMYRLRARRWTREIIVAAAITGIAVGFLCAALFRASAKAQTAGADQPVVRPNL